MVRSTKMYQLSTEYAWYDTREESKVVLVYMIQGIPFTFDELPEISRNLPEVVETAEENKRWSCQEMYPAFNVFNDRRMPSYDV